MTIGSDVIELPRLVSVSSGLEVEWSGRRGPSRADNLARRAVVLSPHRGEVRRGEERTLPQYSRDGCEEGLKAGKWKHPRNKMLALLAGVIRERQSEASSQNPRPRPLPSLCVPPGLLLRPHIHPLIRPSRTHCTGSWGRELQDDDSRVNSDDDSDDDDDDEDDDEVDEEDEDDEDNDDIEPK